MWSETAEEQNPILPNISVGRQHDPWHWQWVGPNHRLCQGIIFSSVSQGWCHLLWKMCCKILPGLLSRRKAAIWTCQFGDFFSEVQNKSRICVAHLKILFSVFELTTSECPWPFSLSYQRTHYSMCFPCLQNTSGACNLSWPWPWPWLTIAPLRTSPPGSLELPLSLHPSVGPPPRRPAVLSIHLSVRPVHSSVFLSISPSFRLFIRLSVPVYHLSIRPSVPVHPSVHQSDCLSMGSLGHYFGWSFSLSVCPSTCPSIRSSIRLSLYPSVSVRPSLPPSLRHENCSWTKRALHYTHCSGGHCHNRSGLWQSERGELPRSACRDSDRVASVFFSSARTLHSHTHTLLNTVMHNWLLHAHIIHTRTPHKRTLSASLSPVS